jgi:CheY-like chemotaxis protein
MFCAAPILIAEDNLYLALDLSNAIEDMDGKVVGPASTLAEALQLLEQHTVAAAIVDSQLAEHDTVSLARVLAQRQVPFVIHTSTAVPATLSALHAEVPVLIKPLRAEAVITCLLDEMRRFQRLPMISPVSRIST